jgi:hypothetical protein
MDGHCNVHHCHLSNINVGAQSVGWMSLQEGTKRDLSLHSSSNTVLIWCLLSAKFVYNLILDLQYCFKIKKEIQNRGMTA